MGELITPQAVPAQACSQFVQSSQQLNVKGDSRIGECGCQANVWHRNACHTTAGSGLHTHAAPLIAYTHNRCISHARAVSSCWEACCSPVIGSRRHPHCDKLYRWSHRRRTCSLSSLAPSVTLSAWVSARAWRRAATQSGPPASCLRVSSAS